MFWCEICIKLSETTATWGCEMRIIFSSLFVLFLALVVIQTVSAIPVSVTEVGLNAFETQSIIDRHRGSSWHELFRLNRYSEEESIALDLNRYEGSSRHELFRLNRYEGSSRYWIFRSEWRARLESSRFGEKYTGGDVPLSDVGNLLGPDPITVTTVDQCCDFFEDDFDYERGVVDVPEPKLIVLIALGLVGFGLARRMKH